MAEGCAFRDPVQPVQEARDLRPSEGAQLRCAIGERLGAVRAILKGGLVLELRLEWARTTKDIDLRLRGQRRWADFIKDNRARPPRVYTNTSIA